MTEKEEVEKEKLGRQRGSRWPTTVSLPSCHPGPHPAQKGGGLIFVITSSVITPSRI